LHEASQLLCSWGKGFPTGELEEGAGRGRPEWERGFPHVSWRRETLARHYKVQTRETWI